MLLIANVQGAVSPFGTLLPYLTAGPADARVVMLAQVRDQLDHGPVSPALGVMLDEYVRWHMVKGTLVGLLAAALTGLAVRSWRPRRWLSLLLAVAALVVVAANVSTVVNPGPPFLLLLQGG